MLQFGPLRVLTLCKLSQLVCGHQHRGYYKVYITVSGEVVVLSSGVLWSIVLVRSTFCPISIFPTSCAVKDDLFLGMILQSHSLVMDKPRNDMGKWPWLRYISQYSCWKPRTEPFNQRKLFDI